MKLLFIVKRESVDLTWPEIEEAGRKTFGAFPSRNTVKDWKRRTDGIAPANWAPALAPSWSGGGVGDPVSAEAMARMLDLMKLSGKNRSGWSLKHAHRMVAEEAARKGWDWPKLHTVRRHWNALDPNERLFATLGEERFTDRIHMHQPQHSGSMAAMDAVHGDGREFKVRVRWPDGSVGCPWVVALVDYASRRTVGWAIGRSENAEVTEAAIVKMCDEAVRPVTLTFDNGSAFNSKRIAGGQRPFFRTSQTRDGDWDVPGVLQILGIELRNTGVAAKRSNLQENVWSHLSRSVDNHPAFHGAQRPGPNDPDVPGAHAIDLEDFEACIADGIADLNAETCNRVQSLRKGESRDAAFERLLSDAARQRTMTPLMRRQISMIWKRKTVRENGRIRFDDGIFGDQSTQTAMLRHARKQVLIGFDPRNYDAGAMVCHWEDERKRGRLILDHLPQVQPTAHGSEEGRRNALAEKNRVRKLMRELQLSDPDGLAQGVRADLRNRTVLSPPPVRPSGVVDLAAGTAGALTMPEAPDPDRIDRKVMEAKLKNYDRATARQAASK